MQSIVVFTVHFSIKTKPKSTEIGRVRVRFRFLVPVFLFSLAGLWAAPSILPVPEISAIDLALLSKKNPLFEKSKTGLRLATGTDTDLSKAILYLNFDEPASPLLKDRRGLYRVLESNYTPSKDAHSGDASALFRSRHQKILLRTTADVWPLQHEKAFTISFWLKPRHFFRSSTLFRRISYASGQRRGLEILLEQNYLRLNLDGVLVFDNDREASRSIRIDKPLKKDEWHHLAVSFDVSHSVMIVFLNGKEQSRFALDRKGRLPVVDFDGPELAPIQLGGDFIGQLDELLILNDSISAESEIDTSPYGRLVYNHHSGRGILPVAEASTPVYQLNQAQEAVTVSAIGDAKDGSSLRLYYRSSVHPFRSDNTRIPYTLFVDLSRTAGKHSSKIDVGLGRQYVQFKVEMQPNPEGTVTPVLQELRMEQSLALLPIRPAGVRIIDELSHSGLICLEWRINPEIEIEEQGGYKIHVGVIPGEFEAVISNVFASRKSTSLVRIQKRNLTEFPLTEEERQLEIRQPERIKEWKRSHIRVMIDHRLLSTARFHDNVRRALPYFERNHPYYFAVSAYRNEAAASKLSDSVFVLFDDQ